MEPPAQEDLPIDALNRAFILNFTNDAARRITTMPTDVAVEALKDQPPHVLIQLFEKLTHGVADSILRELPEKEAALLLSRMNVDTSSALLSRMDDDIRKHYLSLMDQKVADELSELLEYPEDSAGRMMQTKVIAFNENTTVDETLARLRNQKTQSLRYLYVLNDAMQLCGQVDLQRIALASGEQPLSTLSLPIEFHIQALDPKDNALDQIKKYHLEALPVVDIDFKLLGTIEGRGMIDALREDLATNMQTMVGVSKEERALSSSWFAVKKRLPWLQVNLLTAFLAAAVVGLFEGTIAKYTALAILLPIAAGQSGNTGAQALAVTMRGLTLREITVRHWFQVLRKEAGAGILNGLATALTCGIGVYLWSQSHGLALIIALAMISSMTIAAVAGALVPIVLKKIGQDPALSSSIILTTITDIAGFMSFLGIATLLSSMLEVS